ncbi:MAG: hypothetical protein RLZZ24_1334 [Pseudomonadota bacterium]|jgi:hypothetical protein
MSSDAMPPLGPPPFRFTPENGLAQGAAFSQPFKALTSLIVIGSAWWLIDLWLTGKFGATGMAGLRAAGWFILGWGLLAWTGWEVLNSQVRLDAQGLHQSWIWHKRMAYDDLAYASLIRVRGLEWLLAPRFYVRTLVGKFAVFYVSDPALWQECERMAHELKTFRQM